ncbi:MAG TPA: ATP-dependent metallopeptidase FtsH/Yme1/Tma family protein [Roseibacterium sp.]|nr:ATP-dependent metallopeptidase FtsH/Yme1/Tma family protein [Roseibacterium sp.]
MPDKAGPPVGPPIGSQQAPLPPWRYIVWALVLLTFSWFWFGANQVAQRQDLAYSEFKDRVRQEEVASVVFKGQTVFGEFRGTISREPAAQTTTLPKMFITTLPPVDDPDLMPLLEKHLVEVRAETQQTSLWATALISLLPWLLIIGLIFYSSRKMQERMLGGGPGDLFGFGKSKARRFRSGSLNIGFDDVAGLENAKRDLHEIIDFLKNPERFRKLGAKIPKGILLMGPPGTGKTLLAKAVAGEAEVPFYSISGSEFIEMFVGVGASRVRDMFASAKKEAPAIIFIDEIDSVGRVRGSGVGGGHDEREQTLNQILAEMDGFEPEQTVVVLAATNRPDVLDPALLRPGRFDRKITLELPRKQARQKILEVHARDIPLADDVDIAHIAARTAGFSGADLENLMNEGALLAGREDMEKVDARTLDMARDKIVLGAESETVLDEETKKRVAYHESGHALLAYLLPNTDPLTKVTIIPRGRALGATEQLPEEERYILPESYLRDRITIMLGGRIAEQVIFGELSGGAEDDLKQATILARRMVSQWGMSEKPVLVAFRRGEGHIFLGREMAQQRDFSEHTAQLIDDEVRDLVRELEKKAQEILSQHREQLGVLAEALLEKEVLEAEQIQQLVDQSLQ